MTEYKRQRIMRMIADNVNAQRRNAPGSQTATDAREENQRLFALLDSHGIAVSDEPLRATQ